MPLTEFNVDIAIIGGGVGGCAAALAALEAGYSAVLTEETLWLGGQLTSQMVPPDEHGWIERFGCTATYRKFRSNVREYYRTHYPLTAAARQQRALNPGNGWVSPLCHEPRVALAVLSAMLEPFRVAGRLKVLTRHGAVAARLVSAETISVVVLENLDTGARCDVKGKYFVDATELGDLVLLAGAAFVTGQESRAQTREPSAPAEGLPQNVQAFSWCFAMEHHEGQNHVGPMPESYPFWRNYHPPLTPPWPDRWLSWSGLNPRTLQPIKYNFSPHREKPEAFAGLWTYRRILDRSLFEPGCFSSDIVAVNWPLIDYLPKSLLDDAPDKRRQAAAGAKGLSLSALYWMQTEAPRPDGGAGWPGLRLRADVSGTADGLAMAPYIRESRRIVAEFTVREQDVSAHNRPGAKLAEAYEDSVGIGSYRIDLHPSTGGNNYVDVPALPFQIPLGALLPIRHENLLPACKNIGTTHITNGCYRLHPVEWNIGESVGALAAFCLEHACRPRAVRQSPQLLRNFQAALVRRGVELAWPADLNLDDGDPHAHMRPN